MCFWKVIFHYISITLSGYHLNQMKEKASEKKTSSEDDEYQIKYRNLVKDYEKLEKEKNQLKYNVKTLSECTLNSCAVCSLSGHSGQYRGPASLKAHSQWAPKIVLGYNDICL